MTLISALINSKGIAVASDSMLTAVDGKNNRHYLEWQKSKIIRCEKLSACLSYWGFAGKLNKIPKPKENTDWNWNTYDWLAKEALNPQYEKLDDFSKHITEELEKTIGNLKIERSCSGIGIHITGYEIINGYRIPELFLVSNYTNTSYSELRELTATRETYKTILNGDYSSDHGRNDYRMEVKKYLDSGEWLIYNNGDPEFFNNIASAYFNGIALAQRRNVLKRLDDIISIVPIIRRPIEIVSKIQKEFYLEDNRLVGGKTHDLSIDNKGIYFSGSGD